jgi:hypothetical protein
MSERKTHDITTVTVVWSQAMSRPDGGVGIRLETSELGSIAFAVDERAIAALRSAITACETHLQQSKYPTRN